jgi:transcription elongation factor Elf1
MTRARNASLLGNHSQKQNKKQKKKKKKKKKKKETANCQHCNSNEVLAVRLLLSGAK